MAAVEGENECDVEIEGTPNPLSTFLASHGISDDILVACEKAKWTLDLMKLIETSEELEGLIGVLSEYTQVSFTDKMKLKKALQNLRKNNSNNNMETNGAIAVNNDDMKNDNDKRKEKQNNIMSKEEIILREQLTGHMTLLKKRKILLENTQFRINSNYEKCNEMVNELCDNISSVIELKRKEFLAKTANLFVKNNDCARIKTELKNLEKHLTKCQEFGNNPNNNNSNINNNNEDVCNQIKQCLSYNINDNDSKIDTNGGTDSNLIDIIYDNGLIDNIISKINKIDINIYLCTEMKDNNNDSDSYIETKEYIDGIYNGLDKISNFNNGQLSTYKEIKMMYPANLHSQNGCVALGKDSDLYDLANETNENIIEIQNKKCFNNNNKNENKMNKQAIFGDRAKSIYLTIVIDIYNHFKLLHCGKLLKIKLNKWLDSNSPQCNKKSLLYEILLNGNNNNENKKLIEKGISLLENIRNGNLRLTKEELKFLQNCKINVGNGINNIRSTMLLLKLKEFEQSQIPYIQEKKALIAMSNSSAAANSNNNNKKNGNNNDNSESLAKLTENARLLRRREEIEVGILRQICQSSENELKNAIMHKSIPFSKEFYYHENTMIFCAKCQIAMCKNNFIKNEILNCNDFRLLKEFRRIIICYSNPKEKFGLYLCKFIFDKQCPKYCTQQEYIINAIDTRIEQVQAAMLEN